MHCVGFSLQRLLLWSTSSRARGLSVQALFAPGHVECPPGPGTEPMSPALAGGFLSTGTAGSPSCLLMAVLCGQSDPHPRSGLGAHCPSDVLPATPPPDPAQTSAPVQEALPPNGQAATMTVSALACYPARIHQATATSTRKIQLLLGCSAI